jgi:hypothetical protein
LTLRHDLVCKLIAGRTPRDPALASQPTLSRFENWQSFAFLPLMDHLEFKAGKRA